MIAAFFSQNKQVIACHTRLHDQPDPEGLTTAYTHAGSISLTVVRPYAGPTHSLRTRSTYVNVDPAESTTGEPG
jgi:hypothetical protein